ncbi:orotidine-5'-phosphate decarboxylase [Salinisphaera sp. USBA-960]|uniref:orotidine-5'-phosphate decarboxylase n=1 Tax=Salinisphaera orenii TaxID=856731 RepID=UPI000DBE21D3|nr:orotidine-5'-phosphate decarboxylase [Salifodinibacter halophilus]NNC26839.1 orotidine-5'-phosphate decarboxylase [Salifodinibacter halophilus]
MRNPDVQSSPPIPDAERLIVALDVADAAAARRMVEALGDHVCFYKVGLELAMTPDYFELIDWLAACGKRVFVDVKLFDVPATVAAAVRQLAARGVDFITVHGNQAIMEAAAAAKQGNTRLLAVTALTSLDRGDLDDLGFDCDVGQLVLSRARRALEAGCDGVVSSGMELTRLRAEAPSALTTVVPGIRPVTNDEAPPDDQKRVMTPAEAIAAGADHIVVGRPIRDASEPAAEAARIQREIQTARAEVGT